MESQKTWANGYRHSTSTICDDNDLALFNDFCRGDDLIGIGAPFSRSVYASPTSSYNDNDLLSSDFDRNDYEWLISPPETPVFSSSEDISSHHHRWRPSLTRSLSASKLTSLTNTKSNAGSRYKTSQRSSALYTPARANTYNIRGTLLSPNKFTPSPSFRPQTPRRSVTRTPSSSNKMPAISQPVRLRGMNSLNSTSPVQVPYNRNSVDSPRKGYYCLSPAIQAWQEADPGFSVQTPPNLRTSISRRQSRSQLTVAVHPKSGIHKDSVAHSGFDTFSISHSQWTSSPSSISSSPTFSPGTPKQLFARPSSTLSRTSTPSPQWELRYLNGSPSSVERNYSPPKKGGLLARMCAPDVASSTCSTPNRDSRGSSHVKARQSCSGHTSKGLISTATKDHSSCKFSLPNDSTDLVHTIPITSAFTVNNPTMNAFSSNSSSLKDRLQSTSSDIVTASSSHNDLASRKSQDSVSSLKAGFNHISRNIFKTDQLSTTSIYKEEMSSVRNASLDKHTPIPKQNLCHQGKQGEVESVPSTSSSVNSEDVCRDANYKSENKNFAQLDNGSINEMSIHVNVHHGSINEISTHVNVVSDILSEGCHQNFSKQGDEVKQCNSDSVDAEQSSSVTSISIDNHSELINPRSDSGALSCNVALSKAKHQDISVSSRRVLNESVSLVDTDVVTNTFLENNDKTERQDHKDAEADIKNENESDYLSRFVLKHRAMQPCSSEIPTENQQEGDKPGQCHVNERAMDIDASSSNRNQLLSQEDKEQLLSDDVCECSIKANSAELADGLTRGINPAGMKMEQNHLSLHQQQHQNQPHCQHEPISKETLSEASTSAIIFCNTIVHEIVYNAMSIASKNEAAALETTESYKVKRHLQKEDCTMFLRSKLFKPRIFKKRGSASNKRPVKQDNAIDLPREVTLKCNLNGWMRASTKSKIDYIASCGQRKNKCFKWLSTSSNSCQCIVM